MRGFLCAAVQAAVVALGLSTSGCSTGSSFAESKSFLVAQPSSPVIRAITSAAPEPTSGNELRVMTFNVRVKTFLDTFGNSWDSRKALLAQTVRGFDPDVLGTQEALADQADYLKEQLPEYSFVGVGRDDGARRGEMCGVYFKTAKFEKMDSGYFWLSSTPDVVGSRSWGSAFTRMVTWVKLRPRDGGQTFCIFDTHFDVFGSHARLESAKLLRQKMQTIAAGAPCVITGDFNDSPGSAPYQTLLASMNGPNLVDAFRATHASSNPKVEGTRHEFHGNDDGPRIDWIITTAGFTPVSSSIIHTNQNGKFPSDHFPVGAVLRSLPRPVQMPVANIE